MYLCVNQATPSMRTKKLNKTRAFVKAFIHKNKQNNRDKVSGFVKIAKQNVTKNTIGPLRIA
jgi:hypothetical protein